MDVATVAIVGTFDSKASEFDYLRERIRSLGADTVMIHTGIFPARLPTDVDNDDIARRAGVDIGAVARRRDRGAGTAAIARGLAVVLPELYAQGRFDAVISMGGSGGTSMVAPAMRNLPLGVPKIIVSTVAGGDVSFYVGYSDLVLIPSITDVAGVNSVNRMVFDNAARAIVGMAAGGHRTAGTREKPVVAATMFGVTTPCVDRARSELDALGWEVLVFHATGIGGRTMERLIDEARIDAVLDVTTTEWCDELFGGILNAGPHRLEAALRAGIPEVVSMGALDMINFGPRDTLPDSMRGRWIYQHNPTTTLVRTSVGENRKLGATIAEKLNEARRAVSVLVPLRGFSGLDREGAEFFDPAADAAAVDALEENASNPLVTVKKIDAHINDPDFAHTCVRELMSLSDHRDAHAHAE